MYRMGNDLKKKRAFQIDVIILMDNYSESNTNMPIKFTPNKFLPKS